MTTSRAFTVQATSGRRRREATQARILAAFRMMLEEGAPVAAMSVDRIVEAAGVSRSTFYAHFPDKRELIARLAAEDTEPWVALAEPVLADPESGREDIERVVRKLVANWHEHAVVGAAIIELAEYDEAARDAWNETVTGVSAIVADNLRMRWAGRESEHADPDTVAEALAWMVERVCHKMLAGDADPEADARATAALTEIVWRVLEPGG
ncbi:MAG: TetR/AcrR family transcriptional regulator [Solirubrobacteraceae bacterium]|nr:TetR/AcrR family transcriptional regulator [Solirubrobacteraceae bacterium]